MNIEETKNINRQHKSLFDEFDKWKPLFMEVRDFINPYIGCFDGEESNSGLRKDEEMLRTMPIKYSHILAAGLQWGITSPTRPWVKFAFKKPELMQSSEVLTWLNEVSTITLDMLYKGRFYPENHQFYLELGVFNTAAMLIEEDDETVINCRTFTIGEFAIGFDSKKRTNQFARNIEMTPSQIVDKFGIDNVPPVVKTAYENKSHKSTMRVKHLICPNPNYDEQKVDNKSMKFADYYWMDQQSDGKYLKKGGFNEFPVMVERYQTNGAEVYGNGPGMWALGDGKQIQLMARDICTAVELGIKPAIQAPSDIMKNGGINMLPAGANFYNPTGGSDGKISTVFQPTLDINSALVIQTAVEECIKEHFSTKVFQLLSDMEKGTRTAREVIELSSEKMSQMGPLIERLQTGYLPQVIGRVLAIGFRAGVFPPPPPEIEGMEMDVEYVSILSQAQKQYVITPIMDTVTSTIQMATTANLPEILDKIAWDEVVDQLGNLNGVPPSIIVSDEQVAAVRQARAEQQQMMNAAAMAQQSAQIAKTASQADLSTDNGLSALLGGPSGGLQQ